MRLFFLPAATPSQSPRQKVRTTNPAEGVDIALGDSGIEAEKPITFGQMLQETVKRFPDHPALRFKEDGTWKTVTYTEYYDLCIRAAKSFLTVHYSTPYVHAVVCQLYKQEKSSLQ